MNKENEMRTKKSFDMAVYSFVSDKLRLFSPKRHSDYAFRAMKLCQLPNVLWIKFKFKISPSLRKEAAAIVGADHGWDDKNHDYLWRKGD